MTEPPLLSAASRAPAPPAPAATAPADLAVDEDSAGGGVGGAGAPEPFEEEGIDDGAGSPWGSAGATKRVSRS